VTASQVWYYTRGTATLSAAEQANSRALVIQSLASDTHSQAARTYSHVLLNQSLASDAQSAAAAAYSRAFLAASAAREASSRALAVQSLASDAQSQAALATSAARQANSRALLVQSLASDAHSQAARTYSAVKSAAAGVTASQVWYYTRGTATLSAAEQANSRALVIQSLASDTHSQAARTYSAVELVAGYVDTEVAGIKAKTDHLPAAPAATGDIPTAAEIAAAVGSRVPGLESYAPLGQIPTYDQFLFMIWAALAQYGVRGTSLVAQKLDGATEAMQFRLDDDQTPTSRVRSA
jgi:hypothetical protein